MTYRRILYDDHSLLNVDQGSLLATKAVSSAVNTVSTTFILSIKVSRKKLSLNQTQVDKTQFIWMSKVARNIPVERTTFFHSSLV